MDPVRLPGKANQSLGKTAREQMFRKYTKKPSAQLFFLHCISCHVFGTLTVLSYLFYSCKLPLISIAQISLSRRQIKLINI